MSLGAILTAVVTPFHPDGSVDEQAFTGLLAHLAENGSDGFVVCGTTGEASTLSDEEHLRVVELAVQHRPEGTTVVAGTGSNDTRHAVHMTEAASALGVDAVLSVTPYYNRPEPRGLKKHYEAIAGVTEVPVVLYNIPSRAAIDLPNELLAELARIDGVDYVKQANPASLGPVDGLQVYAGNDQDLARGLDLGCVGGILVASHVVGPEMQQLVSASPEERAELDARLQPLYEAVGRSNPISIKAALHQLGRIPNGTLRLPLLEADPAWQADVRDALTAHGLLEQAA